MSERTPAIPKSAHLLQRRLLQQYPRIADIRCNREIEGLDLLRLESAFKS